MTLPIVLAITGCVALLVGLFGGGIKAKEIEVPKIPVWPRLYSGLIGVALIGIAIKLSVPNLGQPEFASPASSVPNLGQPEFASPASLEVLSFYQSFNKPIDRPPLLAIPHHTITTGKSNPGLGDEFQVWIIICPVITPSCAIKELNLDEAGKWTDAIDVGADEDDCSVFDIYFVLASKEVSKLLNTFIQTGIQKDVYDSFDYKAKDALIVVRSLSVEYYDGTSHETYASCSLAAK